MSLTSNAPIPEDLTATDLSIGDQYRILGSKQRRRVIQLLDGTSGPVALEELAAEVARLEDERIEDTRVGLHHVHLPMMSSMGVIEYDSDARLVRNTA